MDLLSDVLSLLDTRSSYFAGLKAGGDWAIDFPPPDGIKFNAVIEGGCWLTVAGIDAPVRLQTGDCFLLAPGRAFTLASAPGLPAAPALEVYRQAQHGVARHGAPQHDFFLIGGRFSFGDEAAILLDCLPPLLHVRGDTDQASVLHWALQRLAQELQATAPGAALMTRHLGHMMLLQMLRQYLAAQASHPVGWLFALADPRLRAAIEAMHAQPAQRWTLAQLAAVAGQSRSAFAVHFKTRVGVTPLDYLLRWRMRLATRRLKDSGAPIASIAQALGYDSDSAFSHAFKRVMACSPRQYRLRHTGGQA